MVTDSFSQQVKELQWRLAVLEAEALASSRPQSKQVTKWFKEVRDGLEELHAAAREVGRQNEDLRRQAQELADFNQRKNEFLAMLSHELRNPLAIISNTMQVMDQLGSPTAQLVNLRAMIVRQTQHLARLVDDLLDISRITTGKFKLAKEAVGLATVVARAVEAIRPVLEQRGHHLKINLPAQPVWLEVDLTRLEQVLLNLLDNAAKFTEPNGQIWLTARQEDNMVVLRVRDTGIGIEPELLPHIFDLFTSEDRKRNTTQEGLGVGLTLVRRLVEMHGGSVSVFSEGPGRGSEFIIRLPVFTELQHHEKRIGQATTRPGGRLLQILVVEDNNDAGKSLAMVLRLWGHEVRVVRDGPAALQAVGQERPDVVLLDIGMPGMDGYEVAKRLRAQAAMKKALLIALTGYGQDEDRWRSREAGFDFHLVKPVSSEELRRVLSTLPENGRELESRLPGGNQGMTS
jgi:two-component system CheB/CheR fusion protein